MTKYRKNVYTQRIRTKHNLTWTTSFNTDEEFKAAAFICILTAEKLKKTQPTTLLLSEGLTGLQLLHINLWFCPRGWTMLNLSLTKAACHFSHLNWSYISVAKINQDTSNLSQTDIQFDKIYSYHIFLYIFL